jgi:hypothetical protein
MPGNGNCKLNCWELVIVRGFSVFATCLLHSNPELYRKWRKPKMEGNG